MHTEVNPESPFGGPSVPKRLATVLLGRDSELDTVTGLFRAALAGRAASAVVVGEFGMGKSAVLTAAGELAEAAGFTVAIATASRLETHLSGSVGRQLIEGLTHAHAVPGSPRPRAPHATESLPDRRPRTEHQQTEALDAFFHAVRHAAEQGPVFLGIDNIHLADPWSMRCLAYIRHRVEQLPVMVVLTSLVGHLQTGEVALLEMSGCTPATILLRGLGTRHVAEFLRVPPGRFAEECREVTGGNPFLLGALARRLVPGMDLDTAGSAMIGEVLRVRMHEYTAAPKMLEAVAILGEDASFDLLAQLAGVDESTALEAIDTMVRVHLLTNSHRPALTYRFVRNSVLADMPLTTRAVTQARAARLLHDAGAAPERVGAHLLEATAIRIPWAVDVLRLAARHSVVEGDPELSVRFLSRALEERLSERKRMAILLQLAHAEFHCDPDSAPARVREAVDHIDDRETAAFVATAMILSLCCGPDARLAINSAGQFAARLDAGGPDAVWPLLCMTYLAEAGSRLGPPPDFRDFERQWAPLNDPAAQQSRSGLLALDTVRSGKSSANAVRHFGEALSGEQPELFEQPYFFTLATAALADEPALTDKLCQVLDTKRLPWDFHVPKGALATLARGIALQAGGDLVRASVHYESLVRQFDERGATSRCPIAVLCAARLIEVSVDLGRHDLATALLGKIDFAATQALFTHNYLLYARGRLRAATGEPELGYEDLRGCGRRLEHHGMRFPGFAPWRAHAARTALALGRTDAAARLAEEDLDAAGRWGAPRILGSALTTAGLVRDDGLGEEAERLLTKAVDVLGGSTAKLALAEALTELGVFQARHGQAEKAIGTLRMATQSSKHCGARPLARRAAEALRDARTSLTTAKDNEHGLTKQEYRVALMASQGLTNREIAEALHLTRRTVELHLSGAYRKLGIAGRTELSSALGRSQRVDAD
ncbi:LuxR family transcriptional regulator [Amycolatopsis sp. WAC 04182]|uniref:BREX system ATP-binding domain-containing protein n=1 Tax=Amycolatopsis sp. WAC 04182 TaxID=2203198 RepID=UPI000F77821A|nr:BREX system ATP-binding domain-containing protein [Amycolatopsis sp. WAC 04182]RSN57462.1 LuxR family transcriptional regulator [Amycolatopsis sp. WAC 04182]